MKNSFISILALTVITGVVSCKKKSDDPAPATTSTKTETANQAPTVSITAPSNNTSVSSGTSVTISANATDTDGTITKVEFYDGTTLLNTDTESPYSFSTASLTVGSHSLTAKAYDNGSATTTSAAISLTINAVEEVVGPVEVLVKSR